MLNGKKFSKRNFEENQKVWVQDPKSKKLSLKGDIVGSRPSEDCTPSSYYIWTEDGNTLLRGAKFIQARRSYVLRKHLKRVTFAVSKLCSSHKDSA